MSNSTPNNINIDITNIIESVETVNDIQSIVSDAANPRRAAILRSRNNTTQQKGGLTILTVFQACIMPIFYLLGFIIKFLGDIFKELFFFNTGGHTERAKFWYYLWFCIKCGLYLCIFAVAGPIFIIIGIVMIYRKLLKKMGINAEQLIRERITQAREVS
jgi:hypothetical protein